MGTNILDLPKKPEQGSPKTDFRSIAVDSLKAQSEALELMYSRIDVAMGIYPSLLYFNFQL